jgi:hypothetical protein
LFFKDELRLVTLLNKAKNQLLCVKIKSPIKGMGLKLQKRKGGIKKEYGMILFDLIGSGRNLLMPQSREDKQLIINWYDGKNMFTILNGGTS